MGSLLKEEGPPSTGESSLSRETVILISVGCVLVALALLILVLCLLWRRRRRNLLDQEREKCLGVAAPTGIRTLGTQYRIASVQNIQDRNYSLVSDRKFSESSARRESESLLPNAFSSGQELTDPAGQEKITEEALAGHSNYYEVNMSGNSNLLALPSENGDLRAYQRGRSESTYLDFNAAPVLDSRKCSTTSQMLTMTEIEMRSKLQLSSTDGTQPGTKRDSGDREPLLLLPEAKSQETINKINIPQGEVRRAEGGRFIPKLPPKNKRQLHYKSAADLGRGSNGSGNPTPLSEPSKLTSKSETNLAIDDPDYDELQQQQPILPPKMTPRLPPKQKINKSQDDLARIETQFKTSMSDLRTCAPKIGNYDDVTVPAGLKKKRDNGGGDNEYDDYDEPIVLHAVVVEPVNSEFDDYDDPIHHTRA